MFSRSYSHVRRGIRFPIVWLPFRNLFKFCDMFGHWNPSADLPQNNQNFTLKKSVRANDVTWKSSLAMGSQPVQLLQPWNTTNFQRVMRVWGTSLINFRGRKGIIPLVFLKAISEISFFLSLHQFLTQYSICSKNLFRRFSTMISNKQQFCVERMAPLSCREEAWELREDRADMLLNFEPIFFQKQSRNTKTTHLLIDCFISFSFRQSMKAKNKILKHNFFEPLKWIALIKDFFPHKESE